MDQARRIVVVTEGGPHIWGLVNAIALQFGQPTVVIETPESKKALLRARARRQGWLSALGQLGTMVVVRLSKLLRPRGRAASAGDPGFDVTPPPESAVVRIGSADGAELVETLERIGPGVVLLAGCRLLRRGTLARIACPVLNYHAGIAPKYRGMNGGYWALATGDTGNFGTTVHQVDAGVDTGPVIYQARGRPARGDTIASYALTQAAFSRDICIRAIADALAGTLSAVEAGLPSRQWYHPTLWFYLWTGLTKRVW
jgi:hypothetical protein